jgi:hypothetical protein
MRSPILIAVLQPLNLLMLVASVVAGLISAWWLFPLGLLIWFIMVMVVARDPALKLNTDRGRRQSLSQRFQPYFERVERAELSVFNNLSNAPAKVRNTLQPVQNEINTLVKVTYSLCERMSNLENHRRVTELRGNLTNDLKQIERIIKETDNELVRQDYEESRRGLQARIDEQQKLSNLLERVEAQLLNLSNELDSIVEVVLRVQSLGESETKEYAANIVERLRQELVELNDFEQESLPSHLPE